MKLIGHIVKKDLRRFWFGIVILAGLVALKFFVADAVFHVEMPPRDWNGRLQRYQNFLLMAELLISFGLAVGIVQEDSVPDVGALCQTLPITRGQLLQAKILSLFLVCVVPVLLTLSVGWVLLGLPADQLGWPLAVAAEAQLGLGLVALAFGSLTKNPGQLLFWILGTVLAFVIPVVIGEPMLHRVLLLTPGARLTGIALVYGVWITASLAVIFNQYLGRSRRLSVVFVGAGVLLSFGFFELGHTRHPLDLASARFAAQRELDARITRLGVSVVRAEVALPKTADSLPHVLLQVSLEEPSRGLLIEPRGFYGNWPDSFPLFISYGLDLPPDNDLKRAAEHELAFHADSEIDHFGFGAETRLGLPFRPPWDRSHVPFQGQIDLSIYQTSIDGELPLTKGASLRSAAGTTRVLGVAFDGSIINVDLEGEFSAIGVNPGWFPGLDALSFPIGRRNFTLVNRKTKTVLTPSPRYSLYLSSYAYGAAPGHARLAFILPKAEGGAAAPADWVLVEISMGEGHRSIRSFETDISFQKVSTFTHDSAWQR